VSDASLQSSALVIAIGLDHPRDGLVSFKNHATETGISPTLANIIPGWVFTAELTSALTRLGKMPVFFETIGMPGGYPRIQAYQAKGIFWHDKHAVPSIEAGALGSRYIDAVTALLRRVEREERAKLDRAAAWIAEAEKAHKRVMVYSMGHFVPDELAKTAFGKRFATGVWNSGFAQTAPPNDTYASGDVIVHIGYQHPPYGLFEKARPVGARVVYVDVLRHRDYAADPGVIWIDPMWSWADACVNLDGYDIPILPPSGIVNAAIAWEMFEKSGAT
jgi:hypothetical protein